MSFKMPTGKKLDSMLDKLSAKDIKEIRTQFELDVQKETDMPNKETMSSIYEAIADMSDHHLKVASSYEELEKILDERNMKMNKHDIDRGQGYLISKKSKEKFKKAVDLMFTPDLRALKDYLDRVVPDIKNKKVQTEVDKTRLANYDYLIEYMKSKDFQDKETVDKAERDSKKQRQELINQRLKQVLHDYVDARICRADLLFTTGMSPRSITVDSKASWQELYGFQGDFQYTFFDGLTNKLSTENYKDVSMFQMTYPTQEQKIIVVRNSVIEGFTFDKTKIQKNINNFTKELEQAAGDLMLTNKEIDDFFRKAGY